MINIGSSELMNTHNHFDNLFNLMQNDSKDPNSKKNVICEKVNNGRNI